MLARLWDALVQFLPEWLVRRWPLNKWYHVAADWEAQLAEFRVGVDYIVEVKTGLINKGSRMVQ
jgi:hypothetical protein